MKQEKREAVVLFLPKSLLREIDDWAGHDFREGFIEGCIRDSLWRDKQSGVLSPLLERLEDQGLGALDAEDYRAARRCFAQIAKRKPDYADAWTHLGLIDYRMGRYEKALPLFAKAVDLAWAELTRRFGKPEKIKGWWDDLDTRPYMRARFNAALTRWKLGEHSEALAALRDLVKLDRDDPLGARFMIRDIQRELTEADGDALH